MKEYSKCIYVKFKPEEVEILHDRMKEAGIQNMSAYIRKMAINGYVIIPEWPDLNRVISLHARISNNLNQYATIMIMKYGPVLKRKWAVEEWLRNIHAECFWKEIAVKRYVKYVENMKKWKFDQEKSVA
mgnify:CR=1 FL=1